MIPFDLPPKPKLWLPPKPAIIRPASKLDLAIPVLGTAGAISAKGLRGAGAAPKVLTYKGEGHGSSASSFTFSIDIGTASSDRYVIVGVGGCQATQTISSLTINGVTATAIVTVNGAETSAIYIANVTSGSGAQNVVVNWSGSQPVCGVGVWTLTGISSTSAYNTQSSTANPFTATLSTLSGGVSVAYVMVTNATTYTWTNLTEQFDTSAGTGVGHSGAHDAANTGSSISITCTPSGYDSRSAMVAASW